MRIASPNTSFGVSESPIEFPSDFDIFAWPSVPSTSGETSATWGSSPSCSMSFLPTPRLNSWSVPPSSTSALTITLSQPCIRQ